MNSTPLTLPTPYLIFLGGVTQAPYAKTAFGLRDWAPQLCIGENALPQASVSIGLPRLTFAEARARGAKAVVIGVANTGGVVERSWIPSLLEALECGLDLISGMHTRLSAEPSLQSAAERLGRRLIDVRTPPAHIPIATGRKRSGKRLLTVGTDCALGKKYTALVLTRELKAGGVDAQFRATGQTGILIAGGAGIPMDAVVADFLAGAAELLSPDAPENHWDIIEGQGSLFHPSYAGVSMGLLHGSQPDLLVLCHEVGRDRVLGLKDYATPALGEAIDLHLRVARRTNPAARFAGTSLNTATLNETEARALLAECSRRTGLPAADPMRGGMELEQLVAECRQ
jgi:uncharacterized NAD-dependent epimerase/dehydratase family protein